MSGTGAIRWAIFSDTHGNRGPMREAVKNGPFDAMVHLGDGVNDAVIISRESGIPLIAVSGNEDGASAYPERLAVQLGPHTVLLMHGHLLDINPYQSAGTWERNYESMDAIMAVSGAQLLLFGHTHVPVIRRMKNGIICNPGSHYAGAAVPHSFAIAESGAGGLTIYLAHDRRGEWILSEGTSLMA